MANRYFQCVKCKTLTTMDNNKCYLSIEGLITESNLKNEVCCSHRKRELTEGQHNKEALLNRDKVTI